MRKNLHFASIVIICMCLCFSFSVSARAETAADGSGDSAQGQIVEPESIEKTGWVNESGWRYYQHDSFLTGWSTIEESEYYFDSNGFLATGVQIIDGVGYFFSEDGDDPGRSTLGQLRKQAGLFQAGDSFYYARENGTLCCNEFRTENGETRYFGENCAMYYGWLFTGETYYWFNYTTGVMGTGFQQVDGVTRYFEPESGKMTCGWLLLDGEYYFFDYNYGVMATGFRQVDGVTRHFEPESGKMTRGWLLLDGEYYFFDYNYGVMGTGFQQVDGVTRYFEPESGKMTRGWLLLDGEYYFFDYDYGVMGTGFRHVDGVTRYFEPESGKMTRGWLLLDGEYYFFDYDYGVMSLGLQQVDGVNRFFEPESGKMVHGWFDYEPIGRMFFDRDYGVMARGFAAIDGKTFYFDPEMGNMSRGFVEIGDRFYYFDQDTGEMYTGSGTLIIDGEAHVFQENGVPRSGFVRDSRGNLYWYSPTGVMVTGWFEVIDSNGVNKHYYAGSDGALYIGKHYIEATSWWDTSAWYCFHKDGAMLSGEFWDDASGNRYFFSGDGRMCYGRKTIGGCEYYFDDNTGIMKRNCWVTTDIIDAKSGRYVMHYYDADGRYSNWRLA